MDAIIKIATDALARIRMLFSWEDGQAIPWFGWMKIQIQKFWLFKYKKVIASSRWNDLL